MTRTNVGKVAAILSLATLVFWVGAAGAQTFSSGSTGVLGIFTPPSQVPPGTTVNGSTVTVPLPADGILNFTTVNIPNGVTVKFAKNAANTPVTMVATGDIAIAGIINLDGGGGTSGVSGSANPGASGGPGGFAGGNGGLVGQVNTAGTGGFGPGGAAYTGAAAPPSASYGALGSFVSLLPLFGGSGGSGGPGGGSQGLRVREVEGRLCWPRQQKLPAPAPV